MIDFDLIRVILKLKMNERMIEISSFCVIRRTVS